MGPNPGGAYAKDLEALFRAGTNSGLSDAELLGKFADARGVASESAFATLVERHGRLVLGTCRGILGDDHEAMDAFQATFLVLARRCRSIWVRDSLGPWLHRVSRRAALRLKAERERRRTLEKAAAEFTASRSSDAEHAALAATVHAAIDRLPERYRSAVVLCDLEGLTCQEAARQVGCPNGTLASRLARGRDRLRTILTRQGFGLAVTPEALARFSRDIRASIPSTSLATLVQTASAPSPLAACGLGLASTQAITLSNGVLHAMAITKLKTAAVLLTLSASALTGVSLVARPTSDLQPSKDETPRPVTSPRPILSVATEAPRAQDDLAAKIARDQEDYFDSILKRDEGWDEEKVRRLYSWSLAAAKAGTYTDGGTDAQNSGTAHVKRIERLRKRIVSRRPDLNQVVDQFLQRARAEPVLFGYYGKPETPAPGAAPEKPFSIPSAPKPIVAGATSKSAMATAPSPMPPADPSVPVDESAAGPSPLIKAPYINTSYIDPPATDADPAIPEDPNSPFTPNDFGVRPGNPKAVEGIDEADGSKAYALDPKTRSFRPYQPPAGTRVRLFRDFQKGRYGYTQGQSGYLALQYEGENISEIAAFSSKSGRWVRQALQKPATGKPGPSVGDEYFAIYHLGRHAHAFSAITGTWASVDLATDDGPRVEKMNQPGMAIVKGSGPMYSYDARTGKFTSMESGKD